ncbi:MAG: glycosyltransferase [Proteobacteria bacterium]|nr:glycosyltransferase [Pseudomonadota bacterium]MCH9757710.1 glycosyltransferase [Pseudomonadota bacterium]
MDEYSPLVKIIGVKGNLFRQLPKSGCWGNVRFTLDRTASNYDWLVVYDDVKAHQSSKFSEEKLACPKENTILITYEPSAVKIYGSDFTKQFAFVLTCHEDWVLRHQQKIPMHPASSWYYGMNLEADYSYDALKKVPPLEKTATLSTICSTKQQTHTLHNQRYQFTKKLSQLLPALDWFGHGVHPLKDKSEAMDSYRYHLAVENHVCPHYWTEKLADSFLAYCLPFYYGCPNATEYFPADSLIEIDINDVEKTAHIIQEAISNDSYQKRLPAIIEARRRVLEEHNFFSVVARFINTQPSSLQTENSARADIIYSRRTLIARSPIKAIRYLSEKLYYHQKFKSLYKNKTMSNKQ